MAWPHSAQYIIPFFLSSQEFISWLTTWGKADWLLINILNAYFMHHSCASYIACGAVLKDATDALSDLASWQVHREDFWEPHHCWVVERYLLHTLATFFLILFCLSPTLISLHCFPSFMFHLCKQTRHNINTNSFSKIVALAKGPLSKSAGRKINMRENKRGVILFLWATELVFDLTGDHFVQKRQRKLECKVKGMTWQGLPRNCTFQKKKKKKKYN